MRRGGFTLVEILVVIALIGVMATCAIAPMTHMVKNIRDARSYFGDLAAIEDALELIQRDIGNVLVVPRKNYMAVRKHDLFGDSADDVLAIASGSVIRTTMAPGVVVYKLLREDSLGMDKVIPGLYRWIFPVKGIEDLDLKSSFPPEKAALVLPYVSSFRVEVYVGKSWIGDYSGAQPPAARITLKRGETVYGSTEWFPAF